MHKVEVYIEDDGMFYLSFEVTRLHGEVDIIAASGDTLEEAAKELQVNWAAW